MRKTFERAGFVKEAQLRQAWFSPKENSYYDAVTYGITREDYAEGTTTPVIWEDGVKKPMPPQIPSFPEMFESERLIIRAPELGDGVDVWNAICNSQPTLRKWLPFAQQSPELEDTIGNLRQAIADFTIRKDLRLHLYLKESWRIRRFFRSSSN